MDGKCEAGYPFCWSQAGVRAPARHHIAVRSQQNTPTERNYVMAMDQKVADILEKQINVELFSAYLYLTFADYYDDRGLKGFANWYMIQVQEELDHAKILRRYLLDNDVKPTMEAIAKPDKTFSNDLKPLEDGLEHEQFVTSRIHNCYEVALEAHDIRTTKMLDWFVSEQGEEETNARDLITNMKLFGTDPKGLYDLDREYQTRAYVAQTALPM